MDPMIQGIVKQWNAAPKKPFDSMTAEEFRMLLALFPMATVGVGEARDQSIPLNGRELPIRLYTPKSAANIPLPGLVYYHGGGWVIGNIESHDPVCRVLANIGQCRVVSVEYRLAPEHKFPAAVDDAYEALVWIAEHAVEFGIDPRRLAVGGDSAGGNLAAVAAIIAKEKYAPEVAFQFLLYPYTGYTEEPPSFQDNADGYFLTIEMMDWYRRQYLNSEEERYHPYVAPVLFHDLGGLPPAFIATAQFDPLRDIGKAYADALHAKAVPVVYRNFENLIHGFANLYGLVPAATKALKECAGQLYDALHPQA